MSDYGVRGQVLNWIGGFLTGRTQSVVCEGKSSLSVTVDSGVPQGSVLGPLLFLAFVNDLPESVQSTCRLFADDCLVYRQIKTIDDSVALQHDLTALEEWAHKWGMAFNAKKCYIINTSKKGDSFFYQLNKHVLQSVVSSPYLGVLISEDLTFGSHISNIAAKASRMLGFLKRNLRQCPRDLKETAYFSLVRSGMEYSCCVWDPFLQQDIDKLEKIQGKAARFVKDEHRRGPEFSVSGMVRELGWDSLQDRRRNARLALFFKAVNGEVAIPISEFVTPQDRRTRGASSNNFKHIRANKQPYRHSFIVRTVPDWNSLPAEAKASNTVSTFKSSVERHFRST